MLSFPVGEFVSELQTSESPEGIMKHAVLPIFEVMMAVIMKIIVALDVIQCCMVDVCRRFGGICSLIFKVKE
jgi:hypothetical protein